MALALDNLKRVDMPLNENKQTNITSLKISLLVFLYIDFGEQIEDHRMFDVTSGTPNNISVIILKSCLTLQVILPTRACLVIPSLIDNSARS